MNRAFFLQLVFNASLLMTLTMIYDLVTVRWRIGSAVLRQVPVGIILGTVGVIVMMASWKLDQGIVFDTRSILIGISGLFFGSVPTMVAVFITVAYRFHIGGPAVGMGIAVILSSAAIGIGWRRRRRHFLTDITWRELFLFGLTVHLAMLGCTVFLPAVTRWRVLSNIFIFVLLIYPVATALLGRLIADRLKREQTKQQLLESEERYQNLARIAPVGIFRADENGATTYVNPMWCRISGLNESSAMGDGWLAAVHPEERESVRRGWQQTVRLQKPGFADYRFLRPDGTVSWIMGQVSPEMDVENRIIGFVGTVTDISEHKRAEETIRASLLEKDILLKEVHHRVKNNLMTIIGLIKMQENKAHNATLKALMNELDGRVRSMALVHESLYKSKNLDRIDLQNYIETMSAHIRAQLGAERNILFSVHACGTEADLDIAVPCGLILNELITNAFKHAFPAEKPCAGEDHCRIRVTMEQSGSTFTLQVADNGVGLPQNLDWEKSDTLGLKLIQMLSRQLNGRVEIDRSHGTMYRLSFTHSAGSENKKDSVKYNELL